MSSARNDGASGGGSRGPGRGTPLGSRLLKIASLLAISAVVHVLFGLGIMGVGRLVGGPPTEREESREVVNVTVMDNEPEPPQQQPPEPEPVSPPEPEPTQETPEPEPEPPAPEKEEPDPKPDPEPSPDPQPESEPAPESEPKEVAESTESDESEEPTDLGDLQGLEMESTVEGGEGPTMKVGSGVGDGKVTGEYVDPDKIDGSEGGGGGGGGGDNRGGQGGSGSGCPEVAAEVISKERVSESEYPVAAKRRGIEGTVVGVVTIDKNGQVSDVRIVQSLGHGFDELAEEAFRQWRFKPARRNCQSVRSKKRLSHGFTLTGG